MSALRCLHCGKPLEIAIAGRKRFASCWAGCGATGPTADTYEEAIAAWNRRAGGAEWRAVNEVLGINANQPASVAVHNIATLRSRVERLEAALQGVMNAPLPAGKHTTTGGVVIVPLLEWAAVEAALGDTP